MKQGWCSLTARPFSLRRNEMSVRTVLNQTVRSVKRQVEVQASEVFPAAATGVVVGENHTHLVNFDGGSAVDWFYPGYEHIPAGSSQAGTQPV
jgi:hypothetical protein